MEPRKAIDSYITMNELVLPNDTNTFGDLMGGKLMYWMDIAAYLAASKHCNSAAMTVSVDNFSFKIPIMSFVSKQLLPVLLIPLWKFI